MLLGCWLLASSATLGYDTGTVSPAGGRPVRIDLRARGRITESYGVGTGT